MVSVGIIADIFKPPRVTIISYGDVERVSNLFLNGAHWIKIKFTTINNI